MKLTALRLGPVDTNGNPGPPATVSKSETVGTTYAITAVTTNALGVYDAKIGVPNAQGVPELKIPGEANPISGRVITIENMSFSGSRTAARCSENEQHMLAINTDMKAATTV